MTYCSYLIQIEYDFLFPLEKRQSSKANPFINHDYERLLKEDKQSSKSNNLSIFKEKKTTNRMVQVEGSGGK